MKRITVLIYSRKNTNMWNRAVNLFKNFPDDFSINLVYRKSNNLIDGFRFFWLTLIGWPSIVYMMDIGPISLLTALFMKVFSLGRVKIVLDSGDIPYYMITSVNFYDNKNILVKKILEKTVFLTEHFSYKLADLMFIRGTGYENYLRKRGYKVPVVFLPDGSSCDIFKPFKVGSLKKKLRLENTLVLGVMGHLWWNFKDKISIGSYMIEAMALAKDLPVKAVVIGDGIGKKFLQERVQELGLKDKVIFTGWIKYDEVPKYLNLIDVYVLTCPPDDLNNQIRSTNKLPELFATGKYILSTDYHEACRVIKDNGALLKFKGRHDENYADRLAKEIRKISKNKKIIEKGLKGRNFALKEYDYKILRKKLQKEIRKLI